MRFVCLALCAIFALALVGCGNTYTDEDDYQNFVRWQARYETEKSLVGLLREYDAAYRAYVTYSDKTADAPERNDAISLAFVFEGRTVLTDANIKLISPEYQQESADYAVAITLDSIGAAVFADLTNNNIGGTVEIVETVNGNSTVLSAPIINSAITNGKVVVGGFSKESADDLCLRLWAKCAETNVRQAAAAYNDKRAESVARYSMPDYLPSALPTTAEYVDVSTYLQKAIDLGFTA